MKPLKATLAGLLVMLFFASQAQEKFTQIRVYPPNAEARLEILNLLQIDHFFDNEGGIVAEVSSSLIKQLDTRHIKYKILVDDVYKEVRAQNARYYADRAAGRVALEQTGNTISNIIATPAAFVVQPTFGGYYSFVQMEAAMDALVASYPAIAKKINLGTSWQGRTIWCIKITQNVNTDDPAKPDLLYMGLQHAREAITGASMIFLMQYLAEQYYVDSKITDLVNSREFYIIPCLNPDGWEFNRTTATGTVNQIGGGQRKNRRNVGTDVMGSGTTYYASSQKGVDLNRNWSVDWKNCGAPILGPAASCGSNTASDPTYWGPGPTAFTEPEVVAVRNLVTAAGKNFVVGFDQHSYGPYYSLPYGRRSLHGTSLPPVDSQYLYNTSALMGQYNGMRANDSYGALGYEVAGGFKDWMLMGDIGTGSKVKAYGITGEGAAGGGTSGSNGSFWAPASQIINLCKGMVYQDLQLAYTAGSYVDLQDVSDMAVPAKTGSFSFNIRRIGLQNKPVTITMIPMQNISAVGSPVVVASLPNFNDTYAGSINYTLPATLGIGKRIRFAWKIQTDGYTYYDTVTKFYSPVQLLYDDMEGSFATNWQNTASGNPASGFGYNYISSSSWGFTTAGTGYNGTGKAMSESPAASTKYTTRLQSIAQYKNTFDLSDATAAYLSFWVRHRAENFRDKLRVEVSTNGTTWIPVAGSTTVQEPGSLDGATINGSPALTGIRGNWTREIFDLSAYNGTAALRLRFNFTADNDPSTFSDELDDGFYIDEVKVLKSTASMLTLPVEFISFTAHLQDNHSALLEWKVNADQLHDHFEVERSSNGVDYSMLGIVTGTGSDYSFVDATVQRGNNFYRLKQVDKDGHFAYSKVVILYNNPEDFVLQIYPNPVENVLKLRIGAEGSQYYHLELSDNFGRRIYAEKIHLVNNMNEYSIDMTGKPAQVYVLTVRNENGQIIATQKVIKK